jgi:hypothetical protein
LYGRRGMACKSVTCIAVAVSHATATWSENDLRDSSPTPRRGPPMAEAPAIQADRAGSARVGKPGDPPGSLAHVRDSGSRSRRDTFGAGSTLFGSVPYPM